MPQNQIISTRTVKRYRIFKAHHKTWRTKSQSFSKELPNITTWTYNKRYNIYYDQVEYIYRNNQSETDEIYITD